MSEDNGFPSMTALLGLLAIAGYQNRDKIADMLGMGQHAAPAAAQPAPNMTPPQQPFGQGGPAGGSGGGLGGLLGGLAGGTSVGGFLGGGLNQLVNHFGQNGHGDVAQSWVGQGANQPIAPNQLEQALGPDVLAQLQQKTGLSREDLLARLSDTLPHAVDQYTPNGRLPS